MKLFMNYLNEEEYITVKARKMKKGSRVQQVKVKVIHKKGDWALHERVDGHKGYTITHIPSGLAANLEEPNKKKAIVKVNALGKMKAKWDGKGNMPSDFEQEVRAILGK